MGPARVWTAPNMTQPVIPPFTGQPGVQVDVSNFEPSQFFKLFLTPELVQNIVDQTNLYAKQHLESQQFQQYAANHPKSRSLKWKETNSEEMMVFLGLTLLMGLDKKPQLNMYWSTDPLFYSPIFSATMKRDRYFLILKFLHFNDNRNIPPRNDANRDRLYKVRPLLNYLGQKFEEVYTPGKCIAVDESLMLWKGRLFFRQYIPLKRSRFGIKVYQLCESEEPQGYTYRFHVYTGKQDHNLDITNVLPDPVKQMSMTVKEVIYLCLPLLDKGHWIYMDNFYTGVELFSYLYQRNTLACGTLRANRAPDQLRNTNVQKGETYGLRSREILSLKYADKKDVYMLTTCHTEATVRAQGRWLADQGAREIVHKPEAIVSYNSKMGSVDQQDQLLHPYNAARKNMKWYKKTSCSFPPDCTLEFLPTVQKIWW